MSKNVTGVLYIILSSVSFGLIPILAKLAYRGGANTFTVLFFRFLFAALILLFYLLHNKMSIRVTFKQMIMIFFLGAFGYSATSAFLFMSYDYISVGSATMILYTYPVIVTVLSFVIYKEKLYINKIVSLFVSLVGIYFLVGINDTSFNGKGILMAVMSSIFYSLYVLGVSNSEIKKVNSYVLTFYISFAVCVSMFILSLASNSLSFKLSFYSFVCIILLAFISTVIALMAFLQGVKLIGPSRAAIFSNLEPIVSLILGYAILNENISIRVIAGGVLIVSSILLLSVELNTNKFKKQI